MMRFRWHLAALSGSSLLLCVALSSGQPKSGPTPADILFQKAVKDMQAGQYDEACQALEASLQLAPKPGTVYALGDCEATRGKTQAALDQYTKYLDLFAKMKSPEREKHAERAAVAEEQKKKLRGDLLFEKAKEHITAGRIDEACSALQQSREVDPKPGTVYALADCEATRGKLATALDLYKNYLALYAGMKSPMRDKHGERARLAEQQRKKLDAEAPRLTLVWVGQAPEGLEVTRGDGTSGAVSLGVPFVIDPGVHVFVTRVPGKPPVERKVRLEKGERKVLELTPGETKVVEEDPKTKEKKTDPVAQAKAKAPGMHPWKIGGIVGMGVGGAAFVAGGVFGYLAMQQKKVVDGACDANFVCPGNGMNEVDRFRLLGNASTALFVVGAAAAGTGLTFFLLSPSTKKDERTSVWVRPVVSPGSGFFGVEGAF